MSKRTKLKEHIHAIEEISDILTAMKNLSLMEINRVGKYIYMQEKAVNTIKKVGMDFFDSYPDYLSKKTDNPLLYILIGSERGFCGGFNDNITKLIESIKITPDKNPQLIVIGRKLSLKLGDNKNIFQVIEGPSAAEEIPSTIINLMKSLQVFARKINIKLEPRHFAVIFNKEDSNVVSAEAWFPFTEFLNKSTSYGALQPILYLSPEQFLYDFIDNYLFSLLYFAFYKSFMAENFLRLHHLDASLERFEKKIVLLNHTLNRLRQEEITQEIEVIMLSAEAIMEEIHANIRAS